MAEVYVSYAYQDRDLARQLIEAIAQTGLTVWDPVTELSPDTLLDQIPRELEQAGCVVVLWSEAAAQSEWAERERRQAIQAWSSDRLVLATLDDTPLPAGLRDLHAISIREVLPLHPDTTGLIERVQAVVGLKGRDAAPPTPSGGSPVRRPASRFGWIVRAALCVLGVLGVLGVSGVLLVGPMSLPPLKGVIRGPAPPETLNGTAGLAALLLIVLLAGVAIGAATFWLLSWISRRRANQAQSTALHSHQVPPVAPQVFVSYSREDGVAVEQLAREMEQLGYAVWIDRKQPGSQRYAAAIVRAIRTSRIVAVMCSQHAFGSDHVIREIYIAGDFKKSFIIFQLDPTELPDELLYFVSGFPRVPVAAIEPQQLRSEIARLISA